jgi:hypothetical protein
MRYVRAIACALKRSAPDGHLSRDTLTNSGAHSAVSPKSAHIRDRGPVPLWRWAYEVQERETAGGRERKEAKAKRTLRMSGRGSGSSSALMVEIVELL